jgi:hypothetical protein
MPLAILKKFRAKVAKRCKKGSVLLPKPGSGTGASAVFKVDLKQLGKKLGKRGRVDLS